MGTQPHSQWGEDEGDDEGSNMGVADDDDLSTITQTQTQTRRADAGSGTGSDAEPVAGGSGGAAGGSTQPSLPGSTPTPRVRRPRRRPGGRRGESDDLGYIHGLLRESNRERKEAAAEAKEVNTSLVNILLATYIIKKYLIGYNTSSFQIQVD